MDADIGASDEPIASRTKKPVDDGRWTARVPKRALEYAAMIATDWQLPCIEGTSLTYLSGDVR